MSSSDSDYSDDDDFYECGQRLCTCNMLSDEDSESSETESFGDSVTDESPSEDDLDDFNEKVCFINVFDTKNQKDTFFVCDYKEILEYRQKYKKLTNKSETSISSLWGNVKAHIPWLGHVALKTYDTSLCGDRSKEEAKKPIKNKKLLQEISKCTKSLVVNTKSKKKIIKKPSDKEITAIADKSSKPDDTAKIINEPCSNSSANNLETSKADDKSKKNSIKSDNKNSDNQQKSSSTNKENKPIDNTKKPSPNNKIPEAKKQGSPKASVENKIKNSAIEKTPVASKVIEKTKDCNKENKVKQADVKHSEIQKIPKKNKTDSKEGSPKSTIKEKSLDCEIKKPSPEKVTPDKEKLPVTNVISNDKQAVVENKNDSVEQVSKKKQKKQKNKQQAEKKEEVKETRKKSPSNIKTASPESKKQEIIKEKVTEEKVTVERENSTEKNIVETFEEVHEDTNQEMSESPIDDMNDEDIGQIIKDKNNMPAFYTELFKRKEKLLKNLKPAPSPSPPPPLMDALDSSESDNESFIVKSKKRPKNTTVSKANAEESDKLGEKAVEMILQNDYNKAINQLTKAMALNSTDYRHYLNRCYCYLKIEKATYALADAQTVIQNSKNLGFLFIANLRAGMASNYLKKHQHAETYLRQALSIYPESPHAERELLRAQIGRIMENDNPEQNAIFALEQHSNTADAIKYLSETYIPKGEEDNEVEIFIFNEEYDDQIYESDEENSKAEALNKLMKNNPKEIKLRHVAQELLTWLRPSTGYEKPKNAATKFVPTNKNMQLTENAVWVGNLTDQHTESMLKKTFRQFGNIISVHRPDGKAFGFVNFEKPEDASKLLNTQTTVRMNGIDCKLRAAMRSC